MTQGLLDSRLLQTGGNDNPRFLQTATTTIIINIYSWTMSRSFSLVLVRRSIDSRNAHAYTGQQTKGNKRGLVLDAMGSVVIRGCNNMATMKNLMCAFISPGQQ
ncbi:MAG: hypothetical protein U9P80_00605 [Thermodesulfobacteriota bacterium]|nr:hypothetical protein [Thermodesulfobacteriota bacterium]